MIGRRRWKPGSPPRELARHTADSTLADRFGVTVPELALILAALDYIAAGRHGDLCPTCNAGRGEPCRVVRNVRGRRGEPRCEPHRNRPR